jgi:hypothetical protein
MELSLAWEAASCVATQTLPTFYRTWRFITVLMRAPEALCNILEETYFLWYGVFGLMLNLQAEGPPLGSCLWLLIQYIFSIHNLRIHHTMMTRDLLNMVHNFNTHFYTNYSLQENWCSYSGYLCNLSNTGILK